MLPLMVMDPCFCDYEAITEGLPGLSILYTIYQVLLLTCILLNIFFCVFFSFHVIFFIFLIYFFLLSTAFRSGDVWSTSKVRLCTFFLWFHCRVIMRLWFNFSRAISMLFVNILVRHQLRTPRCRLILLINITFCEDPTSRVAAHH